MIQESMGKIHTGRPELQQDPGSRNTSSLFGEIPHLAVELALPNGGTKKRVGLSFIPSHKQLRNEQHTHMPQQKHSPRQRGWGSEVRQRQNVERLIRLVKERETSRPVTFNSQKHALDVDLSLALSLSLSFSLSLSLSRSLLGEHDDPIRDEVQPCGTLLEIVLAKGRRRHAKSKALRGFCVLRGERVRTAGFGLRHQKTTSGMGSGNNSEKQAKLAWPNWVYSRCASIKVRKKISHKTPFKVPNLGMPAKT